MLPFAPRYDVRIRAAVEMLDDREVSVAEVWRRVGAFASEHDLPRPSYQHISRQIRAKRAREDRERARREAMLRVAGDVAARVIVGRFIDPYAVAARIDEIEAQYPRSDRL